MPCITPFIVTNSRGERVPVPCGRCPKCKIRKVNDWVFRLQQEERTSISSCFLTLTYNTDSVPISPNGFMTLDKSDYQKFMKRLRKNHDGPPIKYYACGEYGSKTLRPHYHAILFNCDNPSSIEAAWTLHGEPIGNIHCGTVSTDSIAYTLKYISKPGRIPLHRRDDRTKEFSLMSKNLGKNYLSDAIKTYHRNHPYDLRVQKGEHKIAMPKYYRQKIWDPVERDLQIPVIQSAVNEDNKKLERNFFQTYPNGTAEDFERWKDSRIMRMFNSYYHHTNNNRDKI